MSELAESVGYTELPHKMEIGFIPVVEAVKRTKVFPAFANNPDMQRNFKDWPHIDAEEFAQFAIPLRSSLQGTPHVVHFVDTTQGRGRIDYLPQKESPLAKELQLDARIGRVDTVGIHDPRTGLFYPTLAFKGNGPTGEQQLRAIGKLSNEFRRNSVDTWGLMRGRNADQIEMPNANALAQLGFRVSQVPFCIYLDGNKLADIVDPLYQSAAVPGATPYSVKKEMTKPHVSDLAFMARLGAGSRIHDLSHPLAGPQELMTGVAAFIGEIRRSEGGINGFCEKYRIQNGLVRDSVKKLAEYDDSTGRLSDEEIAAHSTLMSFMIWRNFHLQNECNRVGMTDQKDVHGGKLGPIWLNYKPLDIDAGGYVYDFDAFNLKRQLAKEHGQLYVTNGIDRPAILTGLSAFGQHIKDCAGVDIFPGMEAGNTEAQNAHEHDGFLAQGKPVQRIMDTMFID